MPKLLILETNTLLRGLRHHHVNWCQKAFAGRIRSKGVKVERRFASWAKFTPAFKLGRWDGTLWYLECKTEETMLGFIIAHGNEIKGNHMDRAMQRAEEIFTKPGLLEQVRKTQSAFLEKGADGLRLLADLKDYLREESEFQFEQMVKDHPCFITVPKEGTGPKYRLTNDGEPMPLFEEVEAWLSKHVPHDQYIAFPDQAAFRYKDCYYNIYFKDIRWATYFKVGYVF